LSEKVVSQVQHLYSNGKQIEEICDELSIKPNTLKKSIRSGQIILVEAQAQATPSSTKSERSLRDDQPEMGKACTNTSERILASKTASPATIKFGAHSDVSHAGVLLSLPALLTNGLLQHNQDFKPDRGYYSLESIFISLAFLALLRAKTLAKSSSLPNGELGKALGLDRIPEVKTLRKRIKRFCGKTDVKTWASNLSKQWMAQHPGIAGVLYIDGHVKIYYGSKTNMPKHFVSRQRLCMSGSIDYWVNDMTGQPYFVVNEAINTGLIDEIRNHIVPKLNSDVPNQPSKDQIIQNPLLCKYMLVFDREGYSPDFFYDLWQENIAICTYKKYVKEKWPNHEFSSHQMQMPSGEIHNELLAERGVLLQTSTSKKKIWCREVRKLTKSGHQTSIITTNYLMDMETIGAYMFSRWSQENFFKYMMENFGIDTLISYQQEKIDDTKMLVNPQYRKLEAELKKITGQLTRRKAKFATLTIHENQIEKHKIEPYIKQKATLLEEIQLLEEQATKIKKQKKDTDRKTTFGQLPDHEKFTNAINQRKHFIDTIKMIAYRAETAMCNMIRNHMSHPDEARLLLKQIYQTDADLYPDYTNKTLTVSIHRLNYRKDDKILQKLCDQLNQTQTNFPDTEFTLWFKLVSK